MWAIKILNGPQQGKVFPLQKGNNILGRSQKADIRVADSGISKNHAQIFVTNDKAIISDLKSSNGTFVNGVKVQNHGLKTGDKILINQTVITIFQLPDNVVFSDKPLLSSKAGQGSKHNSLSVPQPASITPFSQGETGLSPHVLQQQHQHQQQMAITPVISQHTGLEKVIHKANNYIDNVALPPIYRTTEKFELKYVLMMFTLAFVFIVTFLSIVPLSKIARDSVFEESKRRAISLARNLEQLNRKALAEESDLTLNVDFVTREPGVERALILSARGGILAPSTHSGKYINDPFIASLKKTDEIKTTEINDKQIGASVPSKFYDPDTGDTVVKAYAVVVYNIDAQAVDFKRTLSLFIQVFFISTLIGLLIYFVQYRMFLRPLQTLNDQMDDALKARTNDIHVPFMLKPFQDLIVKINSALSQLPKEFENNEAFSSQADKSVEASDVVNLFPVFAFAVDPVSTRFIAVNQHFYEHSWFNSTEILNTNIDEIAESSLNEVLRTLVMTAVEAPNTTHSQQYKTQEKVEYEITVKAISEKGRLSYLLFTVMQIADEAAA
ncbi:MAG: FHA domain-containing protein [Bdellovibrionales bacterium]|nr:FHA domain-containing protein [Bdellovibrionales bacterium]